MSNGLFRDLIDQLERRKLLVVVGAGVSVLASGEESGASWIGLLRDGAQRVTEVCQSGLPTDWLEVMEKMLSAKDDRWLLYVAEEITARLGGPQHGEFRRWLRDSVGQLRLTSDGRALVQSLAALQAPIATTNYDGLIEEGTGLEPVLWSDSPRVQRFLRHDEEGVLHLHGHWKEPESVVLGIRSYDSLLAEHAAQHFQQVMASMSSLLFVGFGAGLRDPNFVALRKWLKSNLGGTEYRHFRLCRRSEFDAIAAEHGGDSNIKVLPYGSDYADLVVYLRSLSDNVTRSKRPQQLPVENTGQLSRERVAQAVDDLHDLSVRTLPDAPELSLKVAPVALRGMDAFSDAPEELQRTYLTAIQSAYNSLTLNTFARSRELPVPACKRLHQNAAQLVSKLQVAAERQPQLSQEVRQLVDHLERCLHLELTWREYPEVRRTVAYGAEGLDFIRRLYEDDLLVYHNWEADNMSLVKVSMEACHDVTTLENYYSPWYLRPVAGGYQELTYNGHIRAEDRVTCQAPVPGLYPAPLQHVDVVRSDLRRGRVSKMRNLLRKTSPRGFTILAYEFSTQRGLVRLVLDGNHRLAAALRMQADGEWASPDHPAPLVAVFVLTEGAVAPLTPPRCEPVGDRYCGFNPEVERLHRLLDGGKQDVDCGCA